MNREYHRWYSHRLGRDMELLLYGHSGEPVLMFPTSRGRFYQNEDFGLVGAVGDRIQAGRYLVVCVDSIDEESWLNRHLHPRDKLLRHAAYESYLLHEVVPLLMQRSTGGRLTLAGCSFGGFHTFNIGLRHPHVFRRLVSMSGKFETEDFLDGYHDDNVYFHSCTQWVPNLSDWVQISALQKVEMVLAAGEHDFCRASNERLSSILWKKDIGNHLSVWNGGTHDWPLWRQMIQTYLPW
jgi:esterase/lipase superfamily enzyme